MGRFAYSPEGCNDGCASAGEDRANKGESGKRFFEEQGCEGGIEDKTGGLECRQDGQRESGDLNCTAHDVRKDKHEHAQLPSPPFVSRPSDLEFILLIFKEMRLALKSQSETLDRSRDQPNNDAKLERSSVVHSFGTSDVPLTATLPCGERSPI